MNHATNRLPGAEEPARVIDDSIVTFGAEVIDTAAGENFNIFGIGANVYVYTGKEVRVALTLSREAVQRLGARFTALAELMAHD